MAAHDTGEIVQNYSGKTEDTSTIVFEMDMSQIIVRPSINNKNFPG